MFRVFEVDDLHPVDFDTIILDVHHDVIRFDVCTAQISLGFYRKLCGQSLAGVHDPSLMKSSEASKSLP